MARDDSRISKTQLIRAKDQLPEDREDTVPRPEENEEIGSNGKEPGPGPQHPQSRTRKILRRRPS